MTATEDRKHLCEACGQTFESKEKLEEHGQQDHEKQKEDDEATSR